MIMIQKSKMSRRVSRNSLKRIRRRRSQNQLRKRNSNHLKTIQLRRSKKKSKFLRKRMQSMKERGETLRKTKRKNRILHHSRILSKISFSNLTMGVLFMRIGHWRFFYLGHSRTI